MRVARRGLPWLPLLVAMVLGAAGLWLEAVDPRGGESTDPIMVPLLLAYGVAGGLIASRERRNAVGWLLSALCVSMVSSFAVGRYAIAGFDGAVAVPFPEIGAAMAWTWILALSCPVLLAFLVPNGRPLSRGWSRVLAVVAVTLLLGRRVGSAARRWALGIPLALYAVHHWDLVAVAPAVAGLLAPGTLAPSALVDASQALVVAILPIGFFAVGATLAENAEHGELPMPPPLTRPVAVAVGCRLAVAPALLMLLAAPLIELPSAYRLLSAMPTGINTMVVAHAYGLDMEITAEAVTWSTAIVVLAALASLLL